MRIIILLIVSSCFVSCMAPRTVTSSGKATPKGNFVAGADFSGNIPSQTVDLFTSTIKNSFDDIIRNDSIDINETFNDANKAVISYSLDPVGVSTDFYIKYGLFKRFEIGYRRTGGINVFSGQYQFLGSTGYVDDDQKDKFVYGSISMQYSSQSVDLPSIAEDFQSRIGFVFKRKDILIPIIFSRTFGSEEKYGSIAFGFSYSHSWIDYASYPIDVYNIDKVKIIGFGHKTDFSSYGGFLNLKVGYKYVYLIPSIAIYYQNYGRYQMLNGNYINLKGLTIIPTLGFQIRIGKSES